MKRIFLSLIFILIALISISSACATSDFDNNIDVIDQQDIVDDISDISIDDSIEPLDDNASENDASVENYTEDSDETSMNDTIIDNENDSDIIIDNGELEDEFREDISEAYPIESVSSDISDSWMDELINNMANEMIENLTKDAFIPDVDVQPINASIDILGPTFNAAMHYYAYWVAYKNYFGIFQIQKAIVAIYALVYQSYGGLDTMEIVNVIFDMDPSISHDDGGSRKQPNIIV